MSLFHSVLHALKEVNSYSDKIYDGQHGNDQLKSSKITRTEAILGLCLFLKIFVKVDLTEILRRVSEWAVTEAIGVYLVSRTLYHRVFSWFRKPTNQPP